MGSEHYCLRWNNHQSNLLGVFSQLLQDEALVDVTLACEGHSLRAHKVVLSACSAYFHGLFAAHPDRHPIVILQDAKFSELRTLVDFMYRGEVNVEYGRLSGLLRTAESLKVKGLAETTESNRGESRGARPSPSILGSSSTAHMDEGDDVGRASPSATSAASPPMANPLPPDSPPSPPATTSSGERRSHAGRGEASPRTLGGDSSPPGCHSPPRSKRSRGRHGSGGSGGSAACLGDMRGGSVACHRDGLGVGDSGDTVTAAEDVTTPGVASPPAPSPPPGGPIPGPSGLLLPVQRVPLSLKKEVEWDRTSTDDKSGTGESSSDYRHPHESDFQNEAFMRTNCYESHVGAPMEDIPGYGIQQDGASGSYKVAQFAENLTATHTPLLTHTLRKRVSVPYDLHNSPLDSEKSVKLSSPINTKRFKVFPKQQSSHGQSSNTESESSLRPVFHHFLSSMSNFAFNTLSPSPELQPQQLDGKENNDYAEGRIKRTCEAEGHKGKDTNDRPFRCDQCGQSYKYGSAFARHREQDHRARPPAEKPFGCDACGMRFRYLKSFKKHRLNHTLDRLRSKNYASNKDVTNPGDEVLPHSWKMEDMGEIEEGANKASKSLSEIENGEEEERIDEERIEEGSAENDTESDQQWIVPWQSGNEPNTSPVENTEPSSPTESTAPSVATQDSSMWEQIARTPSSTHSSSNALSAETEAEEETYLTKERSYLDCPFCRKGFRSRENLRLHVRKHTGERPFECSVCGRAFGGKSDMTRHLRIHTGERPYRCDVCSKRFARADYLSKHLTTHLH